MKKLALFVILVILLAGIAYIHSKNSFSLTHNTIEKEQLLSPTAFVNSEYGIEMYPPKDWIAKKDDYFNAQILFLDKPQSHISDFASSDVIISVTTYKGIDTEELLDLLNASMENTVNYANLYPIPSEEIAIFNNKYSLLKDALLNKITVSVGNLKGIQFDYGNFFGGTGLGKTIIVENNNVTYMITAEVKNENAWNLNKDKAIQSMMSFRVK